MTEKERNIKRVLLWYDLAGDSLIGECELKGLPLDKMRELYGLSNNDPMYDAYPVSDDHVDFFQKYCSGHEIDLKAYNYFVQAYVVR